MERGDGDDDDDDDNAGIVEPAGAIDPPPDDSVGEIRVLEWPDNVRRRPEIFVGPVDGGGMHALLWQCVGESVNEHLRGHVRAVRIDFDGDVVVIEDDGRGLSVGPRWPGDERTALELALTTLFFGGVDRERPPTRSLISFRGYPIACALASELDITVWRAGHVHVQRFARGLPTGPARHVGESARTGTRIRVVPDFTILPRHDWDRDAVVRRCDELAALLPGLTITVEGHDHHHADGLAGWLRARGARFEPLRARARADAYELEIAIALSEPGPASVRGFVNNTAVDTGTHVDALVGAVHAVLARRAPRLATLAPAAFRALLDRSGAMLAIHLVHERPELAPMPDFWHERAIARTALANADIRGPVHDLVKAELPPYFERVPALLDALLLGLDRG